MYSINWCWILCFKYLKTEHRAVAFTIADRTAVQTFWWNLSLPLSANLHSAKVKVLLVLFLFPLFVLTLVAAARQQQHVFARVCASKCVFAYFTLFIFLGRNKNISLSFKHFRFRSLSFTIFFHVVRWVALLSHSAVRRACARCVRFKEEKIFHFHAFTLSHAFSLSLSLFV